MNASSNDFQLELSMSLNSSTEEVSITLDSIYTGPDSSVVVYVYGAVTEKIGADSYDNGIKTIDTAESYGNSLDIEIHTRSTKLSIYTGLLMISLCMWVFQIYIESEGKR